MPLADLAPTLRLIKYQFRTGRLEQAFTTLMLVSVGAGGTLSGTKDSWPKLAGVNLSLFAQYGSYVAYALAATFALLLAYRIWKQAIVVEEPPPPPPSAAIKGLLPFTEDDGKLFARLGRSIELQRLLAITQSDQIGICAVRGQSGAGKSSLLQAGLAFTLGKEHSVYWEAVPIASTEALLHAIRSRFPEVTALESLPGEFPHRCVLILDQFEQLSQSQAEHAPIFALLDRIAKAPAPRALSAVVGFRREYFADWMDFEQQCVYRAEHLPINLLAAPVAAQALTVLATEAGFTLDQALVDNFIASVTAPEGVSPVDIAIGVLSLANFVQQRGVNHVDNSDYTTAGGAEGLLLSFVQEKFDDIPQQLRGPLLTGLVLALVDTTSNQRVAAGATAPEIAAKAQVPENLMSPYLNNLTHPRVRLLEKTGDGRYRLPHERLVPVLRRLGGLTLAEKDQVRIQFENEFRRWCENKASPRLLGGKDLTIVLRNRQALIQGHDAAQKEEYLAASVRRRMRFRVATLAVAVVLAASGYLSMRWAG